MSNFRVTHENVVVVLIPDQKQTENKKGSLFIPETSNESNFVVKGRIVEVGSKCEEKLYNDDVVLFDTRGGLEIKVNGEEYWIMKETNILVVLGN